MRSAVCNSFDNGPAVLECAEMTALWDEATRRFVEGGPEADRKVSLHSKKSEITTAIARCAVTRAMNSSAFTKSVPRRFDSKNSTSRMTRRTWLRPLRGGMNFSTSSLKRMRPTLSLLRMAEKASTEAIRSEEHTSELQSLRHLVCRLL